jgi:transcriptional regulator with XRE-family HTH domain
MTTTVLAAFGLAVKPNVALSQKWHSGRVWREKKIYWERSKSDLQTAFVRRITQAMRDKNLSDNEVARIIFPGDPTKIQSSISRITACKQEPSLEKIEQFARALNIPALSLLMEIPRQERDKLITLTPTRPIPSSIQRPSKLKAGDRKRTKA